MSDPSLGFVLTRQRSHVQVIRKDDGGVSLVDLRTLAALDFPPGETGALAGLLDRAAMPGQRAVRVTPGELAASLSGIVPDPEFAAAHALAEIRAQGRDVPGSAARALAGIPEGM